MKHLAVRSFVPATTAINANTSGNSFRQATEKPALELKLINMTYRRDTATSMRGIFNLLPAQASALPANSPVSRTRVTRAAPLEKFLVGGSETTALKNGATICAITSARNGPGKVCVGNTVKHVALAGMRMVIPLIAVRVAGETRPIAPNDTPQNRALNRCVEIEVSQHAR